MNHPPLPQLAQHLRDVARLLDTWGHHNRQAAAVSKCPCITCKAHLLGTGSLGYPSSTMGDGTGTRSTDPTSSTERAAGITTNHPPPFANIDHDLATELRTLWHTGLRVATTIDRITTHAPDDDPVPPGTGPCTIRTCETVCRPDGKKNSENRLKNGLCPACSKSWYMHLSRNPNASLVEWRPIRTAALRPKPVTR